MSVRSHSRVAARLEKATGPIASPDRRDHVADLVVFQLLRCRALLVDVVALALAECPIHLAGGDVQRLDRGVVEATLVAGVLEHGQRLAAVIDEHPLAAPLVPGEPGIGGAGGQEESVLLVDLREVHGRRRLALLERSEALRGRRLADVHAAVLQPGDRRGPGGGDGVLAAQAFLLEEAGGDRRDQR